MLEVRVVRKLFVASAAGTAGVAHLSAASGLVRMGSRVFVVADDENHLGLFDVSNHEPGQLVQLFDGQLPLRQRARKAAKPDCEALLLLPAFGRYPCGALMALGSGSRPSRQRAALVALDSTGELHGTTRAVDVTPLLEPLRDTFPELNIEGAFVRDDRLCLLQRGSGRSGLNACIELRWADVQGWLESAGTVPRPTAITQFDLGSIGGVPLSFTDGAALPEGGWLFSAAAEDTSGSYDDGVCTGSAVGIVTAGGSIQRLEPLSLTCKVEGVAVSTSGDMLELLLVTDADDRNQPALLLAASLQPPG